MNEEELKYIKGMDLSTLPENAGPVLVAVAQANEGKPVTTKCPSCGCIIKVESKGSPPTAWVHGCECGECNGTMRGL